MAVSTDIVQSWRNPRAVMRRLLSMGRREDRALAILMAGCGLIFVAQWPRLSREAYLDPSIPLDARIGGALFAWIFWAPILAYLIGALSHFIARSFGGKGSWYSARLALFWAILASSPAWLLHGLVAGFMGPGPAQMLVGAGLLLAFAVIWAMCFSEAERAPERES